MGADVGKRFIYIMTSYSDNDSCQSLQPPLVLKPILTFPREGTGYPANELQPPLVLPRRITHPNLPQGKEQVTLPMNFSPLSFSPVGEMQVTPNCHEQVSAGYSC